MEAYIIIFLSLVVLAIYLLISHGTQIKVYSKRSFDKVASWFFVKIPQNHIVCVVVNEGYLHLMAHSSDVEILRKHLALVPDTITVKGVAVENERKKSALEVLKKIKTRDKEKFWGIFVKVFNLHLKHWNPLARLKKIKVIRTMINPKYSKDLPLSEEIIYKDGLVGEEETEYLRIVFPRVGISDDVVLQKNAKVDFVWSLLGVGIWDPYHVFFVNPGISKQVDYQFQQAIVAYFGALTYEELKEQMEKRAFNADPNNEFNIYLATKAGIYAAGFILTEPASIFDWKLDETQEAIAEAELRRTASGIDLEATRNIAAGKKEMLKAEGEGRADAIRAEGEAKADAAKKLVAQLGQDGAKHVLGREALPNNSGNKVVIVENDGDEKTKPTILISE